MLLVKSICSTNFAASDAEYTALLQTVGKEHTIYQIDRVVHSPHGGDLDSVPLKRAFDSLKYGNIFAIVEHVDEDGTLIPESKLTKNMYDGYASKYQRVLRVFDIRTVEGVDAFLDFAFANDVKYDMDNFPGHLTRKKIGSESYEHLYERLDLPLPDEFNLDKFLSQKASIQEPYETHTKGNFLSRLFHRH